MSKEYQEFFHQDSTAEGNHWDKIRGSGRVGSLRETLTLKTARVRAWMSSIRGILPLTVPRMAPRVSFSSARLTTDMSMAATTLSLSNDTTGAHKAQYRISLQYQPSTEEQTPQHRAKITREKDMQNPKRPGPSSRGKCAVITDHFGLPSQDTYR